MKVERKTKTAATKARKSRSRKRVILFPDEPPTIPVEKIEAAVRAVIAARTKGEKASS
jgi:hypothetical protein